MTHFALLWKARTIEKYRQNYENEKINSIIKSNAEIPDKTLLQRWRHYSHDVQKRLSRSFSKWYPEGTTVSNFFVNLKSDMRLPTILLRSLYGFVGGLLLTYLGFMFFVFQLSLSVIHATILCSVLGVILTLGLTFSNRMRCIIVLLIPQLFSRVGRYTLTCYALVLILTGPATNTLKNSEVLSESMACRQEQIKLSIRYINESIRRPFNAMTDSLKITIRSMKLIMNKLKITLIKINRLILSIASVIQSSFAWLDSVANRCNEALGSPHQKCLDSLKDNYQRYFEHNSAKRKDAKRTFRGDLKTLLYFLDTRDFRKSNDKEIIKDCKRSRDKEFKEFTKLKKEKERVNDRGSLKAKHFERSNVQEDLEHFRIAANIAKLACDSLKSYDKFCVPADFTEETFLATIRKKFKTFTHRLNSLFHVKLNIHHTYNYIGNSSSTNLVQTGIVTEIRNRADPLLTWLSWSSCVTSLFILLIIFRAKHYQHMFETRPRFDNRFITKEFRELDLKRLREGKATVLPLNRRERAKYVTTTSFRLVASEKFHLNRSAVFMTIATFKLLIHIVADYSLYWVLMTIQHHGKLQSPLPPGIPDTGAFISGAGFVARLLQAFIDTLNIQLSLPPPDKSCLPNPYPPDFKRYCQIGFLIFLLWFFAIFEPYGLRIRHLIMGHHRPERAKDRAEWLYNHILRTRASFMKFARRRLHRKYKYYLSHSKLTFQQWMRSHIPIWLRFILRIKPEEPFCLLCYSTKDTSDPDKELIKCGAPNCPGAYCTSCFSDIGQLCSICLSPSDYGDFSDVSLVNDDEDDSDSETSNYNGSANNSPSDDNRSSSYDGVNTTDGECVDASRLIALKEPRTSNYGKQKKYMNRLGNCTRSEIFSLLQEADVTSDDHYKYIHDIAVYKHAIPILVCANECPLISKNFETYCKNDQECSENIDTFKDLNNNKMGTCRKTFELCQYGVYEITKTPFEIKKYENTTQFAKYLRKKKIIRRKRKDANKKIKYFMTCGTSNTSIHTVIEGNDNPDKDAKSLKKSKSETTGKNNYNKSTNPPDKQSYPKNDNTKFKNKKAKSGTFHKMFAKYWKSVKFTILPCTCLTNTKRDLPPIKEKKHKRKKKRKKSKICKAAKKSKLNKNVDNTENSRLFAYLHDRDWVKNRDQSPKQLNNATEHMAIGIAKERTKDVDENMIVNNVLIPRLNLNLSSNSIVFEAQINAFNCENAKNYPNLTRRINYAKGAIDRFFKSIADKASEFLTTSSDEEEQDKNECYSMHRNKSTSCVSTSRDNHTQNDDVKGFRLKRMSSGNFSGYNLLRPISYIKKVYSSLFPSNSSAKLVVNKYEKKQKRDKNDIEESEEKEIKQADKDKESEDKTLQTRAVIINEIEETEEKKIQRKMYLQCDNDKGMQTVVVCNLSEDKAVTVIPTMKSCACQNFYRCIGTRECGVQIEETARTPLRTFDEEVMATKETCTCATQYQHDRKHAACNTEIRCDNAIIKKRDYYQESLSETSSMQSEGSRTDTTICSLVNIAYHNTPNRSNRAKRHTTVVTIANKSTLTDKARHFDVTTDTCDWWSPIVEKKKIPKREDHRHYPSRKKECEMREKVVLKNRGTFTGDKMVQFRSRPQLVYDRERSDMLTPLRYLVDSQKHYNELFSTKFYVNTVTNSQEYQNQEREYTQVGSRHHCRRGRKAKRLEECYTPRKQASPRRRGVEFVRAQESSGRITRNKPRNKEECNKRIIS